MFAIEEKSFTRKISLIDTIILGVGSTIGAGIFLLLSSSLEIAGPAVIIAFAINALLAFIIAFNYAEAASFMPVDGGGFSFVEAAYGNRALFLGWVVWLGNIGYAALTAVGIGDYLSQLIPVHPLLISTGILLFFSVLNAVGSKNVASIEKPLTIALVLALVIAGAYLFTQPMNGGFTPLLPNGLISLLPATSLLFMCFIGFETITTISAEVKKPRTNIPKALLITVSIVSILYLFVAGAAIYSTSIEQLLAGNHIALIEAVAHSPEMQGVILMAAILAMMSSLNVALMAGARNVYALSRDKFLPKQWGEINERFQSPLKAVILTTIIALLLILTGSVEFIASVSNISYMLMVSAVGLAVLKFRKHENPTSYKMPLYPYTAYACIGLPLILIPFLESSAIITGFSWLIIGIMIYLFRGRRSLP